MDEVTRAYIKVHGELREGISYWHHNKQMFESGWACALAWMEEQEELLELEKDVLHQQEELR